MKLTRANYVNVIPLAVNQFLKKYAYIYNTNLIKIKH